MGANVSNPPESGYVIVAVLLMVLICLFLPMMAMLYFDTLTLQKKTEKTEARIEKLVKNPNLAKDMGERLYETVKDKYDLTIVTKTRAEFYKSIV
jgi:hypothetical protein